MSGEGRIRLRRLAPGQVESARSPAVPREVLLGASDIIDEVATGGEAALRRLAERFDGLSPGEPLSRSAVEMDAALGRLRRADVDVLERTAERVRSFAEAQLSTVSERSPTRIRVVGSCSPALPDDCSTHACNRSR